MSEFYKQAAEDVMEALGVTDRGLDDATIIMRRQEQGFNELVEANKKNAIGVFLLA